MLFWILISKNLPVQLSYIIENTLTENRLVKLIEKDKKESKGFD